MYSSRLGKRPQPSNQVPGRTGADAKKAGLDGEEIAVGAE